MEEPRGAKVCGSRPAAPQVLNAVRRQRQGMKRMSRKPGPSLLTTCALPAKRTGRAIMKKEEKRSTKNTCPRKGRSRYFLGAATNEATDRGLVIKLKIAKPHFISMEAPWATGAGMKQAHAPPFSGLCRGRKPGPRPPRLTPWANGKGLASSTCFWPRPSKQTKTKRPNFFNLGNLDLICAKTFKAS